MRTCLHNPPRHTNTPLHTNIQTPILLNLEFARRYLISTIGVTFDSIDRAHMIFDLPNFVEAGSSPSKPVEIIKCPNGMCSE